eukprot:gene23746-9304_t
MSGRVPWNKGRKHSPETIAKIKARTAEAMQRPEVAAKVKAYKHVRTVHTSVKHTDETKEKIGKAIKEKARQKRIAAGLDPDGPPKRKVYDRSKAKAKPDESASSDGESSGESNGSKASTSGSSQSKKKWLDPEYRAKAVARLREAAQARVGGEPKEPSKTTLRRRAAREKLALEKQSRTGATPSQNPSPQSKGTAREKRRSNAARKYSC